jgi:hypothetical protein
VSGPMLAGSAFNSRTTSGYNRKLHTVNGGVRAKARAGWRRSDVGRGARMPRHSIYEYLQVLATRLHESVTSGSRIVRNLVCLGRPVRSGPTLVDGAIERSDLANSGVVGVHMPLTRDLSCQIFLGDRFFQAGRVLAQHVHSLVCICHPFPHFCHAYPLFWIGRQCGGSAV